MATGYDAKCLDCGESFTFIAGPLMAGKSYICPACGDTVFIPHRAPEGAYEMSEEGVRQYIESGDISLDGREYTASERQLLEKIYATCKCGGQRVEDEDFPDDVPLSKVASKTHRCPRCRSNKLSLEISARLD